MPDDIEGDSEEFSLLAAWNYFNFPPWDNSRLLAGYEQFRFTLNYITRYFNMIVYHVCPRPRPAASFPCGLFPHLMHVSKKDVLHLCT